MKTIDKNYKIEDAFADLIGKGADRDNMRKIFSGLLYNYSRAIIKNAVAKEEVFEIPEEVDEELYFLNQLVRILDGTYHFSCLSNTL